MKRISHRAHSACNETGDSTGTGKICRRSSSYRRDDDGEGHDRDDGDREKAFQPFISHNHLVPVRAGRESEADCGKQDDRRERHRGRN